jgi:hypothetical protein
MDDARAPASGSPREAPPDPAAAEATPWTCLRGVVFVALNVALVALYLDWLVGALPPIAGEGRDLVVLPVSAIATVGFAGMYPALLRAQTHLGRLAVLGSSIAIGMTAYTGYVVARLGGPEPTWTAAILFGVTVALAQALYGAPLFLAIAAFNKLLSPFLLARPVRAWV